MSDPLHHECGVAAIRLLKPLSYFEAKYGSPDWAFNKLFLLMEKQHNRGQDGAGIGCIKLNMPLGEPYVFRARDATKDALTKIFNTAQHNLHDMRQAGIIDGTDCHDYKTKFDFGGEILMGHMRYGTSGRFDEGSCHPYLRRTNWATRTLMMLGNFNMTNTHEINQRLIQRGQHPVFDTDTQAILADVGFHLDDAHNEIYRELRGTMPGPEIPAEISRRLDLYAIVGEAAKTWDGGFCVMGGVGNGVIHLTENGRVKFDVYLLDSGDYDPFNETDPWGMYDGYDGVRREQIEWVRAQLKAGTPSLFFQHIPVCEIEDSRDGGKTRGRGIFMRVPAESPHGRTGCRAAPICGALYAVDPVRAAGVLGEEPCPQGSRSRWLPRYRTADGLSLYDVWKESGCVKGAYFGHDHANSYDGVNDDGMRLGASPASSFHLARGNGVRIFRIRTDGTYETRVVTEETFRSA